LLWAYGANERNVNVEPYQTYYPGADVVDILATDVYRGGFAQADYDELTLLAGNKPIALAEVGAAPAAEILGRQPRWVWFMNWHDPSVEMGHSEAFRAVYESKRTLTLEELPWVHLGQPKVHYPVLK
jgi:mannan endo-1,4-beta-mannosidase